MTRTVRRLVVLALIATAMPLAGCGLRCGGGGCGGGKLFGLGHKNCDECGCHGAFCGDCSIRKRPSITAKPASAWNQGEPCGIPFYLPKPLLVVSKNVLHIEDAKVGLTNSAPVPGYFDAQSEYADLDLNSDASTSGGIHAAPTPQAAPTGAAVGGPLPILHSKPPVPVTPQPGDVPDDGLGPNVFYTYEIVFIPDLAQKYVLEVKGGAGEIRAAMNLVNGWQFTGLGPYYMKDSSSAQNIMARGVALNLGLGGASDVISSMANLGHPAAGAPGSVKPSELSAVMSHLDNLANKKTVDWSKVANAANVQVERIQRYAEIRVFEPVLQEDGHTIWQPVINEAFDREFLKVNFDPSHTGANVPAALQAYGDAMRVQPQVADPNATTMHRLPMVDTELARNVVNHTLGVSKPQPQKNHCFFKRKKPTTTHRQVSGFLPIVNSNPPAPAPISSQPPVETLPSPQPPVTTQPPPSQPPPVLVP